MDKLIVHAWTEDRWTPAGDEGRRPSRWSPKTPGSALSKPESRSAILKQTARSLSSSFRLSALSFPSICARPVDVLAPFLIKAGARRVYIRCLWRNGTRAARLQASSSTPRSATRTVELRRASWNRQCIRVFTRVFLCKSSYLPFYRRNFRAHI